MIRIIVILETKIYVYNFLSLQLEKKIETIANPKGLIALNGSKDTSVMACLASVDGAVNIVHFDKGHQTLAI